MVDMAKKLVFCQGLQQWDDFIRNGRHGKEHSFFAKDYSCDMKNHEKSTTNFVWEFHAKYIKANWEP